MISQSHESLTSPNKKRATGGSSMVMVVLPVFMGLTVLILISSFSKRIIQAM
jgi:hypothetical protein